MLVLTRKLNETIRIGDNVTITIVRVKGRAVGVGIEAPREVRISRGEIDPHAPPAERREEAAQEEGEHAPHHSSTPIITEALKLVLDAEQHRQDNDGESPATLHQVIHRRMRRSEPSQPPKVENRLARPQGRVTLRDFLTTR